MSSPKAFISYSHDTPEHCERVLMLAKALRGNGIDVELDQFHNEEIVDWPRWCNEQTSPEHSEFVLCVCTAEYRRRIENNVPPEKGKGAYWEGSLLDDDIYDAKGHRRILPLLLSDEAESSIPRFLRGWTFCRLREFGLADHGYEHVIRILTGQARVLKNELGLVPVLPPVTPSSPISPPASSTKQPPEAKAATLGLTVERPGLIRALLDRYCPKFHRWLTKMGTLRVPTEMDDLADCLGDLLSEINGKLSHPYIDLHARLVAGQPLDDLPGQDPFVRPVSQRIREVLGLSQGGDAATARIVAIDRKSRAVGNLVKALRRTRAPLVLLGDPGTGKTMTLMALAKSLLEREQHRVYPSVTLYVRLGEFHVDGPVGTGEVLEYVKMQAPTDLASRLEALDHAGRLVILFDGMDEMSRDRYSQHTEALSRFAGKVCNRTKTLFSCRITDFSPMFTHQRLVLLPFGRSQILEYLHRYKLPFPMLIDGFSWSARNLAKELANARLAIETTNPFVLWLLCFYLYEKQHWPVSRVALLEFYFVQNYSRKLQDRFLKKEEENAVRFPEMEQAFTGWGMFACEITIRNRGSAISVALLKSEIGIAADTVEVLIAVGKRCGVLVESHDRHKERLVRFTHHRFQEYFAARYICNAQPSVDWASKLDSPRWQETLVNVVLIGGRPEGALLALARSLADLVLRLRSAASANLRQQRRIARAEEKASQEKNRIGKGHRERTHDSIYLPAQLEITLADRLQLASRIVRQGGAGSTPGGEELMNPVNRAIAFLSLYGNPISHVKIMEACQNIPGISLISALKRPLRSKVDWVRNQAITVIAESAGGARASGTDYATELGYDLVTGEFPSHVRAYAKAALAGRSKGLRKSLLLAVTCYLAALVFILSAAVGIYNGGIWCFRALDQTVMEARLQKTRARGSETEDPVSRWLRAPWPALVGKEISPWQRKESSSSGSLEHSRYVGDNLNTKLAHVSFVVLLIGTMLVAIRRNPGMLWTSLLAVPWVCLVVGAIALLGWAGFGGALGLVLLVAFYGTFVFAFAASGVGSFTTWSMVAAYLALTRPLRGTGQVADSILNITSVGGTIRKWPVAILKGTGILAGLALSAFFLVCIPCALAHLGVWMSKVSRLPFLPIWNDLIISSPLLVWIGVRWIWPWLAKGRNALETLVIVIAIPLIVLFSRVIMAAIDYVGRGFWWLLQQCLGESTGLYLARALSAVVLTILLVFVTKFLAAELLNLMRRKGYPPGSFTPDEWKRLMEHAPAFWPLAFWQEDLFARSNHQSVGLTPEQFADLLREVQQMVKEEPALSVYWDRRHQLEQVLKQEKQG